MSKKKGIRALAERLGFFDPIRAHASEVVDAERQLAKVSAQITKLKDVVDSMDARLLDCRAEMARLHYGARKAVRNGAEPRALRFLSDKRVAETKVRELEEEVDAGRALLRQAQRHREELSLNLENLQRSFEASRIVRLASDVARGSRAPAPGSSARRLESARRRLLDAETLAQLEDPEDPFAGLLPELAADDDRLLMARWRAEDRARAA